MSFLLRERMRDIITHGGSPSGDIAQDDFIYQGGWPVRWMTEAEVWAKYGAEVQP